MNRRIRACTWCQTPLPDGSRPTRRYCSTSCPVRAWHARNEAPAVDPVIAQFFSRSNPKHYHVRGTQLLVGHRENVPWFGPSCPPQCPGLRENETYRPMEDFYRPERHTSLRTAV